MKGKKQLNYIPQNTPSGTRGCLQVESDLPSDSPFYKIIHFTIPMNPVTKKNSMQIVEGSKTGKKKVIPSKPFLRYQSEAGLFMRSYNIDEPVNIRALYYMKTIREVDLTNLHEALHDIMQERRCIVNDNRSIVVSTDGSRVLYDPVNPRTEVYIEFYRDYEDPFNKKE